jgi:putative FmdB family regulatory protein
MPLYEYECESCSHRFEVIQKFSDPPVEKCPKCGGAVHKLIASPAIQFKGTGWYITDYAKKDSASAGKAGGSKDGASESKAEKTESSKSEKGGDSGSTSSAAATPAKKE